LCKWGQLVTQHLIKTSLLDCPPAGLFYLEVLMLYQVRFETSDFLLVSVPDDLSVMGLAEFLATRSRPHPDAPLGFIVQFRSSSMLHATVVDLANDLTFNVVAICEKCAGVSDE